MANKTEREKELRDRLALVTGDGFIEDVVHPRVAANVAADLLPKRCKTSVVQDTGTGRVTVSYRFGGRVEAFGKLYSDELGCHGSDATRKLWSEGFGMRSEYRVSEPLVFLPERQFLLLRTVPGRPLMDFLGDDGPELCTQVRRAARWLVQLHSMPLRIGQPDTLWESLKLMRILHRITKAAARAPDHRPRMIEMVRALTSRGEQIREDSPMVLTHGRYHYEHVFVDGNAVSVIDFDRVRPSDPAKDVAEFVSLLRHRTFKRKGSVATAEAPTRAFLDEYLSALPDHAENLPVYWGASLLMTVFHYVKKSASSDREVQERLDFYESEFELALSNRLTAGS